MAWDTGRRDWRTFRVDRLRPRTPTGPRFTSREPPEGGVAAYLSRRLSARIRLHAPVEEVASWFDPRWGQLESAGKDACVVEFGGDSLHTMAAYIGMLDTDFDVEEPAELREHLLRLAHRLGGAAQRVGPGPAAPRER